MTRRLSRREALALLSTSALALPLLGRSFVKISPMLTRPIPSSGEQLPVIGLGTWQTFDIAPADPVRTRLEEVLSEFVRLGGRLIDSSPMYGRSETVVGQLAAKLALREKLVMATKVWTSGRKAGIEQMEDSEEKLRGTVDLMQVHNLLDVETHLDTLRGWKKEKRIRYIGVTHYTSSAYDALARHIRRGHVDFVQLNYSLAEREAEKKLLPLAQDQGVAVLVNRPFGAGSLFRMTRDKAVPAFAKELGCSSWAELFLKFVVSHPAVTCAIPATSRPEHLRQNMNAGGGVMPDSKMRARIAAAVG
jgi:diketogulonate reductase-like aldo/keto reductase